MPNPTPDSYVFTPGVPLYVGMPTPAGGTLLTGFQLDNWSGSSSEGLWRGGMPFAKGDVPAGTALEVRRDGVPVAAQFDERVTWSDGSLKFAVCHMRDTSFAGSASRTYEVYTKPATAFDNAGNQTLSTVASNAALTLEISSFTESDGGAPTTRGSGAAFAAFATHAGVATRVTKIHSGPVCEGWQVWGMVNDGAAGAGAADAHLKVIWYVDVWKDAGGSVVDTEFGAVLSQDWWAVANKRRLGYTATLKRSSATVQAYASVAHHYHGQWATVRTSDDNNHARRHWATSIPTLLYKPSKAYWVESELAPPLDVALAPPANSAQTLMPLSAQGHRADVNGTGAYLGRGTWPNCDAVTFMRQTAADVRSSRVNAFAGLSFPAHFRDERTRTRPSESADVANTLVPLLWLPKAESASTFTGLPAPKHAYAGAVTDVGYDGGWVSPAGGTGPWTISSSLGDSSHAVAYSAFAYMHEGERYMLEACIDLATKGAQGINGSQYGGAPFLLWYENSYAQSEMSIPSTKWSAIPNFREQDRAIGWSLLMLAYAAALTPDDDPQGEYMRAWNAHCSDYLGECYTYLPPSLKAIGATYYGNAEVSGSRSPWMAAFIVQGGYQNVRMAENEGLRAYIGHIAQSLLQMYERNMYDLTSYRVVWSTTNTSYSDTNPFVEADGYLIKADCSVASNLVTISGGPYYEPQDGDEVYFIQYESTALPAGYTAGTKLYVINQSGSTFNLSLTLGGSVYGIADGSYDLGGRFLRAGPTVAENPPYLPPADSYAPIAAAALVYAELESCPNLSAGTGAAMDAFLQNVNYGDWAAWKLQIPA